MDVVYMWVCREIRVGVSGSGCCFVHSFAFRLQSVYATIFPYLTFWNYESAHYEKVATAIHKLKRSSARHKSLSVSMLQCSGVHRPHIQCLDQRSMVRSDVEHQLILLASGNLEDRRVLYEVGDSNSVRQHTLRFWVVAGKRYKLTQIIK